MNGISELLSCIVSSGKHHWRFKLWETGQCTLLLGVWDNSYKARETINGKLQPIEAYYTVNFTDSGTRGQNRSKSYGIRCLKSCIIDMHLDFKELDLSFAIDDVNYGSAFKVKKDTSYRGCGYIFARDAKLELLSYDEYI